MNVLWKFVVFYAKKGWHHLVWCFGVPMPLKYLEPFDRATPVGEPLEVEHEAVEGIPLNTVEQATTKYVLLNNIPANAFRILGLKRRGITSVQLCHFE